MQPTLTDEGVRLGDDARQRLHYARGYGRLIGDHELLLAPVEAAYLLYRGDIPSVDGMDFREYLATTTARLFSRFTVLKDLRERGFYLSPSDEPLIDFEVYERGSDPTGGSIVYSVRVVDERDRLPVRSLGPSVLAVVDEEGEVGYLAVDGEPPIGNVDAMDGKAIDATLLDHRVIVWHPPPRLYTTSFYGRPLADRASLDAGVQLSLVEAHYLAERGLLTSPPTVSAIATAGGESDGSQFDRRLIIYRTLRQQGTIPKTGYKFGMDFRVYDEFTTVDDMTHSTALVRVLGLDAELTPLDCARDVRLAHGVGKRMVFAVTDETAETDVSWISMKRITP